MTAVSPDPRTGVPPDPRTVGTRPEQHGHFVLGAVLVVAGAVMLMAQAGLFASPWPAVPALLLVLAGAGIAVEGLRGVWHGTLIGVAVVLTVITALATTAANSWHMPSGGVGDRMYAPETVAQLQEHYELGAGNLGLDLRRLELPAGTTRLAVDVGMGEIEVRVPEGVALDVRAASGTGEVVFFGDQQGGLGVDREYETPGYAEEDPRLELDLSVGMGRIEVTR